MEDNGKRVVSFEIDDNVKKVTITGEDGNQQVVMRQELNEDDLDSVTGGQSTSHPAQGNGLERHRSCDRT
ncbi:MAG: hypothetical protein K6F78_00965 [Bacteroidaceae bacterium]|jgi:hypothetical protein|nr:hypothetical protein [Bacteroidaceae bacterium]